MGDLDHLSFLRPRRVVSIDHRRFGKPSDDMGRSGWPAEETDAVHPSRTRRLPLIEYRENPREKLGHELAAKILANNKNKLQQREAQIEKLLTPFAGKSGDPKKSSIISSISSKSGS